MAFHLTTPSGILQFFFVFEKCIKARFTDDSEDKCKSSSRCDYVVMFVAYMNSG
jgi:hypothetical protein